MRILAVDLVEAFCGDQYGMEKVVGRRLIQQNSSRIVAVSYVGGIL